MIFWSSVLLLINTIALSGCSICVGTRRDLEALKSYQKAFKIKFKEMKLYGGNLIPVK